jgi:hypothetical protein
VQATKDTLGFLTNPSAQWETKRRQLQSRRQKGWIVLEKNIVTPLCQPSDQEWLVPIGQVNVEDRIE